MQGEEVGSPIEEGGNLTSREEVVVVAVVEEEVEVGKEERVGGMMAMISALTLDHLIPASMNLQ